MNRIAGIITAGTLTGTVAVSVLALGVRNSARANDSTQVPAINSVVTTQEPIIIEQIIPVESSSPDGDAAAEAQAQAVAQMQVDAQAQIDELLTIMAEREAAYIDQLEAANQTIADLIAQQKAQASAPSAYREYDDDDGRSGGRSGGYDNDGRSGGDDDDD